MGNTQSGFTDDLIPVKQDIDIQGTGGAGSFTDALILMLNEETFLQQILWRKSRSGVYHGIQKPGLNADVLRFRFIHGRDAHRFDPLFS